MTKPVVIFGLGDFARVAHVYLTQDSPYNVAAFTANEQYITDSHLLDTPIVPFERLTETHPPDEYAMLVAVGFKGVNKARADVYHQCKALGYELITYINSKAAHWGNIEVGDNVFIFEENVIQPFVKIGSNTILWSGNHIGHDVTIGSHVFIASHVVLSGRVVVRDYTFIGVNATVADNVTIAESNVIGAGTLITRNTKPEEVYKGTKSTPAEIKSSQLRGF